MSLGALVAAGKAALDTADNLSKLSQKTGISVESLSLLKPIAEQSGISLEGLAKGMQKLATAMVEAAGGSKEQVEAFSRLGVSVKDLRTGAEFAWHGDYVSQSASMAKVMIVLMALVQAREGAAAADAALPQQQGAQDAQRVVSAAGRGLLLKHQVGTEGTFHGGASFRLWRG